MFLIFEIIQYCTTLYNAKELKMNKIKISENFYLNESNELEFISYPKTNKEETR